jgi:DNA-binding response OmpR family regulator
MKRRVLLVDDEVAVLLTLKAVLEISGFDVDTAASAREGKLKLRSNQYQMVITDMRMESDQAGADVIQAARTAPYHPAVALLTAHPIAEEDWQEMGADRMLVKPMHTRMLLQQIESLLLAHESKPGNESSEVPIAATATTKKAAAKKTVKKSRSVASANSARMKRPAKNATKRSPRKTVAKRPVSKSVSKKTRGR